MGEWVVALSAAAASVTAFMVAYWVARETRGGRDD